MKLDITALVIAFLSIASLANAAETSYHYAVYGGGFHVVDASLTLKESVESYDSTITAGTQGFLSRVAPWSSVMVSKGQQKQDAWQPTFFENTTKWRDDAKTTILKYNNRGQIINRVVREQGREDDTHPADPKLAQDATDLPTGIMGFLRHRNLKEGCEGSFPVYDGKRRFQVKLASQENNVIESNRYTSYEGDVISCSIEVIQDGGKWAKENRGWFRIQEDSRATGELPRVFMTELNDQEWLVPVRLELSSPYGNFVMHLTRALTHTGS